MKINTTPSSVAVSTLILMFALTGCSSVPSKTANTPDLYYAHKAEREAQCAMSANHEYPGYPARRGVLTNYWFTQAYDRCLEKGAVQEKQARTSKGNAGGKF